MALWGARDNAKIRAEMEKIAKSIATLKECFDEREEQKRMESECLNLEVKEIMRKAWQLGYKRDETELHSLQNELSALQEILDDRAVPTLQQYAETAAFKSLGEAAAKLCHPFCCGGRLELEGQISNILLYYKSKEAGELREIKLPRAEKEALTQLLSAGSIASFGKGNEQVTDLSYRDAFKLDPDELTTSFHPGSTSILSEIEMIMVPNRSIRAELHKLNMYTGPGGHFKSHVDTPRSKDMFGSLVVCLPTQFTGGALVTRHKGEEKVFDWSSSPEDPLNVVCWAAFFSDVEHEILPVTCGHRLTVTYNLYFNVIESKKVPSSSVGPFHTALKEALYAPHFLRNGGCLGFDCKHAYVFSLLNKTELLPHLLKGADYAVFSTAKSLGLKVAVKPIMEGGQSWYVLPKFSRKIGLYRSEDEGDAGRFCDSYKCDQERSLEWEILDSVYHKIPKEITPGDISRCSQPNQHQNSGLFGVYTYYGNEAANLELCYQSAIILVELPAWGEAPRTLTSESDSEPNESESEPEAECKPPGPQSRAKFDFEMDDKSEPMSGDWYEPEAEPESESVAEPPKKKQKINDSEGVVNSRVIISWRKKDPQWVRFQF